MILNVVAVGLSNDCVNKGHNLFSYWSVHARYIVLARRRRMMSKYVIFHLVYYVLMNKLKIILISGL